MIYTTEYEAYHIRVSYRRADGYKARRAAVLLMDRIVEAGEGAAVLRDADIMILFDEVRSGAYRIAVTENRVEITVGGILAMQCVKNYFERLLTEGLALYSAEGDSTNEFEDSNKFAFACAGDRRIMFYNVLWGGFPHLAPAQRNIMTAELAREFSPAVIALQECGFEKRSDEPSLDIVCEMERVGYREVPAHPSELQYKGYNCAPLFYDPEQVTLIECSHHWYTQQSDRTDKIDQSSKSLTWGVFEDKRTNERYAVVGTHMCTQDDAIRETQAREACAIFDMIEHIHHVPIIFGGDFNSLCTHRGYLYYREQGYPDAYELATMHRCDARRHHPYPAYKSRLDLVLPTADATYQAAEQSVDHVLYPHMPKGMKTYVYGVAINDYSLAASDHFPIFVDVSFEKGEDK